MKVGRFLGQGSAKRVHVSEYEGCEVAVLCGCSRAEMTLMRQLSSEYIVRMVARLSHDTIATELAEHGSLLDLQDALEFEGKAISSDHITTMVLQVQLALNELWNLGYVHDDVAERNVLVFRYGEDPANTLVKLGDLGEARPCKNVQSDVEQLLQMNLRLRKEWEEHVHRQEQTLQALPILQIPPKQMSSAN